MFWWKWWCEKGVGKVGSVFWRNWFFLRFDCFVYIY